jgi:hypothetical protein
LAIRADKLNICFLRLATNSETCEDRAATASAAFWAAVVAAAVPSAAALAASVAALAASAASCAASKDVKELEVLSKLIVSDDDEIPALAPLLATPFTIPKLSLNCPGDVTVTFTVDVPASEDFTSAKYSPLEFVLSVKDFCKFIKAPTPTICRTKETFGTGFPTMSVTLTVITEELEPVEDSSILFKLALIETKRPVFPSPVAEVSV